MGAKQPSTVVLVAVLVLMCCCLTSTHAHPHQQQQQIEQQQQHQPAATAQTVNLLLAQARQLEDDDDGHDGYYGANPIVIEDYYPALGASGERPNTFVHEISPDFNDDESSSDSEEPELLAASAHEMVHSILNENVVYESVFSRSLRIDPEMPVSLMLSCMSMLAQGGWEEDLDILRDGALSRMFLSVQTIIEGDFVDMMSANPDLRLDPWVFEDLSSPITQRQVQQKLEQHSDTALMMFWNSLMCSACNAAFQQCESLGNNKMKSERSDGSFVSEWPAVLGTAATTSRLSLQTALDMLEMGATVDEIVTNIVGFTDKVDCGHLRNEVDVNCERRARSVLRHKILILKSIVDGQNVCLAPRSSHSLTKNPFFASNFAKATKELNKRGMGGASIFGRPRDNNYKVPDYAVVAERIEFWAQSFVTQRVCPIQAYRWAVHFTQSLDTDMNGATTVPYVGRVRMVFNPLSQLLPWEMHKYLESENSWVSLRVDDLYMKNWKGIDPMSTAIMGLELWSASQTDFSNTMMAWLKAIVTRKGMLPTRFKKLLETLQVLGSKHNLLSVTVSEDDGTERVVEVEETLGTYMNVTDAAIGSPDAVSWVTLFSTVSLPDEFQTVAGGMSMGFSMLATGFFLWNAIFVDNNITKRLYSTMQGGLVWADIYIHVALAAATHGVWVPIVAAASVYVATRSLFSYLKARPWFQRRFPSFFRMTEAEFLARQQERRTEVCFAAFYSAVFVAENTARDVMTMKFGSNMHREALTFDAPSPERLHQRENVEILFHDLLFALMDPAGSNPVHNIQAHQASPSRVPMVICGRVVEFRTKYITPATALWASHMPGLDETKYKSCRKRNENKLLRHRGNRIPCSPSEFVLAFYHAIKKKDSLPPLINRVGKVADNILSVIASPSGGIASIFRDTIVDWHGQMRSFQVKLFKDQDLGMLSVWFTLHMFHVLTFRSTDEREVTFHNKFRVQELSRQQYRTGMNTWLLPPSCTPIDKINHELVLRSSAGVEVPQCKASNPQNYECGDMVNICSVVADPLSTQNWRIAVVNRALNEGERMSHNVTMTLGRSAVEKVRLP